MKLTPTTIEFQISSDPPLHATATYDSEFKWWSAHISMSCNTGASSPEAAIGDLALLAKRFVEAVEESEKRQYDR